jgi:hypothetical protein
MHGSGCRSTAGVDLGADGSILAVEVFEALPKEAL